MTSRSDVVGDRGADDADAGDVPVHRTGLHREKPTVRSAQLFHGPLLILCQSHLCPVISVSMSPYSSMSSVRWYPGTSVASQSRMRPAVHSGTSSCGTWPTSGATSKRHDGLAAAAARDAPIVTSLSFSPCSSSTGTRIAFMAASYELRRVSMRTSERAAPRKCSSVSGYPLRARAISRCCSRTSGGTRDGSTQHRCRMSTASCSGVRTRRVADQDRRAAGHLAQEPVQHVLVGGDRGRVRACLGVT